jgi:hypothetical protein
MQIRIPQWHPESKFSNPTKSQEVNDLILRVTKKEVCGQGVPSKARQPWMEPEYRQLQLWIQDSPECGNVLGYGVPALFSFRGHMISCIDCASQWQNCFFEINDMFPGFSSKACLAWSKNVGCESHAP